MYNTFSQPFAQFIKKILSLGHHLGLHFDESGINDKNIKKEMLIWSGIYCRKSSGYRSTRFRFTNLRDAFSMAR